MAGGVTLIPGPYPEKHRTTSVVRALIFLVFIVGVATGGYYLYRHYHPNKSTSGSASANSAKNKGLATPTQVQTRYQQAIDNNLKTGNIESYQTAELGLASGFISSNNYPAAESILQTVQKNVPSSKLSFYYYQIKIQDDVHNQDIVSQKSDLQTLVAMLKSMGLSSEAAYYQKQLDKL